MNRPPAVSEQVQTFKYAGYTFRTWRQIAGPGCCNTRSKNEIETIIRDCWYFGIDDTPIAESPLCPLRRKCEYEKPKVCTRTQAEPVRVHDNQRRET